LGGVPTSILYDNTKLAVARILGDGTRQKTRAFSELQSHYLFAEKFGRPAKGNDKGKVEGLVGYARQKRDYASAIKRYFVTRTFNYSHLNLALNQHLGVRIPAKEVCPIWPGQPMTAHWGVPDPAAVEGTPDEVSRAFRDAFFMLDRRISIFMCLPLTSLDKLAIQKEIDRIGHE
jgi:hypothetical protein